MEKNKYNLTTPQQSIWSVEQFYKNTSVNNIGGTIVINEEINFKLLEEAINIFIKSNQSLNLRLFFDEDGNIKQYFTEFKPEKINLISLNSMDELTTKEKELIEIPFSLLNNPLYNFTMFELPQGKGGIILIIHHIIADAFTGNLCANKIAEIYNSLLKNEEPNLDNPSYEDYILTDKDYPNTVKFEKDKTYWNDIFSTIPEIASLSIKTNNEFDTTQNCKSNRETYQLNNSLVEKINDFCLTHKISKYNFFMGIYSLYIGKINDLNDFTIGTPILNRSNFKEKNTTGMFINTIPFRCTFKENETFNDYITDISSNSLNMLRHQKYSYEYILKSLREKSANIPTLYNILLSYQIGKSNDENTEFDYTVRWTHATSNADELDVHIFDYDDNESVLNIAYDYQLKKYTKKDISDLHDRIINLINQVLNNSELELSKYELITNSEKDYILNTYNSNDEIEITQNIVELFERQVLKTPYNIAISQNGYNINYIDFNNMVNYVANYLKEQGIQENDNVCLFFNNSLELVINIYAVLKLSACYIPIDVSYPNDRVEYIIKDSNSRFILTNSRNISKLNELSKYALTINLDTIIKNSENKIFNNLTVKPTANTLAYTIYTSGSTGKPKGVKIAHESLANYILWAKKTYVKDEVTNFPLYSSIAFDLTVTSVYTPLICGNTLYIYENDKPQLLLKDIIDDKKVQIIKLTPAHLSLLQDIVSDTIITKLIVGGDILTPETCKNITKVFKNNISIFNEYGPTEATVGCMTYTYTESDSQYASVPIGIPGDNATILLLNNDLNIVPFGYNGQMYIGGKCLSKGYVNLDKITKERFICSPFTLKGLLYTAGDIAKLYENGIMEYIGRKDFQVKINGYRIETGEIQSRILNFKGIKDCFVHVFESNGSKLLTAYFVSDEKININDLKNFIMGSLPKYMIPKFFIQIDKLPLTVNGKVDKKALPIPTQNVNINYVAPSNKLEQTIHDIFCEYLNIDKMSVAQNIFDYMVDSLTIIKVQTKLYALGYSVDTQVFYTYTTIQEIANFLLNNNKDLAQNKSLEIENLKVTDIAHKVNKTNNNNNVLLFGSTGFLGIHILHELLEKTNAHIYCIIREKNNVNSVERFKQKYSFYYDNLDSIIDRITPITGDLYEEKFGLSDNEYSELSKKIDSVFSSAAIVKHYGDYDIFYKTNVLGTKKIVDFCIENNLPFNYVSTLSVSGYGLVKTPKTNFTENDFYIQQQYNDNVYVKTKFQAEALILEACKNNNLIASIYRVGNMTNRFSDGVFQENAVENAFLNRISSIINLKCIPEEILNMKIEFTPVDICARDIVALSTSMPNNLNIYHLFNDKNITFSDFYNVLKSCNYNLKITSLEEFENTLLHTSLNTFGITNYLNPSNDVLNNVVLDNKITNELLKTQNLDWPIITPEYIKMILIYLKKYNFIGDNQKDEVK